ncbi:prepilin-type N-terminal cleavage/methylation domain-containing protein [Aliikangiella coralliicola]|uniref:Prepilin-type N-terminal cleavage/methylation domain-containing protein n=1 Tax=Aliikangiella coralliicola TaxID=2592383 RepID=A0A545UGE5_9GAMM|nr:prepilin-type N-terminal cleavage/methylation domain-containing protein [Aliikangiella coralliicola]TQV88541.1 prepilin-type N-terminal cleavage/methylation domain-containing protein [Aliikangiella coralliicola]
MSKSKGFTLIELIVVIVILGIMAAIAGPKFVDLQTDARISVMNGLEGAVRGAATLVYSKSLIEGEEGTASDGTAASQVTVQGVAVDTDFGYPAGTATGIEAALDFSPEISVAHAAGVSTFTYVGQAACVITYTESAAANAAPVINTAAVTAANC